MSGEHLAEVHYSNGAFLVFDKNHALHLRRCRIISQPVSGDPSTGPHSLSPYAAHVVVSKGLATFKLLKIKEKICDENKAKHDIKLAQYISEQKELFITKRLSELKRHNVIPTPRTIGEFVEAKLRLPIKDTPDTELSSFDETSMQRDDVISLVDGLCDLKLRLVYRDLYDRGFYVSSGMKFGSDFLVYLDDPVRYHAQYAIRLVPSDDMGLIDLSKLNIYELNSLQRLTHTANKIPLFVTVVLTDQQRASPKLTYWALGKRVYLTPDSKNTEFESIEPSLRCSIISVAIGNKARKTS